MPPTLHGTAHATKDETDARVRCWSQRRGGGGARHGRKDQGLGRGAHRQLSCTGAAGRQAAEQGRHQPQKGRHLTEGEGGWGREGEHIRIKVVLVVCDLR
jgi:hypothetical protein